MYVFLFDFLYIVEREVTFPSISHGCYVDWETQVRQFSGLTKVISKWVHGTWWLIVKVWSLFKVTLNQDVSSM